METPALQDLIIFWKTNNATPNKTYATNFSIEEVETELAALKSELAAKDELLAECARVIAPFAEIYLMFDPRRPIENDSHVTCYLQPSIIRAAAELAKKLEGMK